MTREPAGMINVCIECIGQSLDFVRLIRTQVSACDVQNQANVRSNLHSTIDHPHRLPYHLLGLGEVGNVCSWQAKGMYPLPTPSLEPLPHRAGGFASIVLCRLERTVARFCTSQANTCVRVRRTESSDCPIHSMQTLIEAPSPMRQWLYASPVSKY